MLGFIKKKFPWIIEIYRSIKRKYTIICCKKRARSSLNDKKRIISRVYEDKIGRPLSWDNPLSYTEKMQVEKLDVGSSMKTILSDKYLVRDWVKDKIGEQYLIPLLGVWNKYSEIDYDSLPNQFVLKTNHGSGTNVIVKDKTALNKKACKRKFNDWMKMDFAFITYFEMHYSGIERKIIAEKYLETDLGELQDYKFICFDGEPCFCWVDLGRYSNHTRTVFDMNWQLQPWTQANYGISKEPIPKPKNFEKMVDIAKVLCEGFAHVRVDLYNIDGTIYFGEMTFTNGSGLDPIVPDKYDYVLGDMWQLNKESVINEEGR